MTNKFSEVISDASSWNAEEWVENGWSFVDDTFTICSENALSEKDQLELEVVLQRFAEHMSPRELYMISMHKLQLLTVEEESFIAKESLSFMFKCCLKFLTRSIQGIQHKSTKLFVQPAVNAVLKVTQANNAFESLIEEFLMLIIAKYPEVEYFLAGVQLSQEVESEFEYVSPLLQLILLHATARNSDDLGSFDGYVKYMFHPQRVKQLLVSEDIKREGLALLYLRNGKDIILTDIVLCELVVALVEAQKCSDALKLVEKWISTNEGKQFTVENSLQHSPLHQCMISALCQATDLSDRKYGLSVFGRLLNLYAPEISFSLLMAWIKDCPLTQFKTVCVQFMKKFIISNENITNDHLHAVVSLLADKRNVVLYEGNHIEAVLALSFHHQTFNLLYFLEKHQLFCRLLSTTEKNAINEYAASLHTIVQKASKLDYEDVQVLSNFLAFSIDMRNGLVDMQPQK
ncbi:hypothetical protein MP638_000262 [Amoeboaphelidium occidentale]|nr:hypothetical protein MP638_000262 [Amoeboaphelidium occidentale]